MRFSQTSELAQSVMAHSVKRLVGRCCNCGGWKRACDRHFKYCVDCRISLKIPKRYWVKPNHV